MWIILENSKSNIAKWLCMVLIQEVRFVAEWLELFFANYARVHKEFCINGTDDVNNADNEVKEGIVESRTSVIPRPIIADTEFLVGRFYKIFSSGGVRDRARGMR